MGLRAEIFFREVHASGSQPEMCEICKIRNQDKNETRSSEAGNLMVLEAEGEGGWLVGEGGG